MKKVFKNYSFGKRPSKAFNCNTFNCGGKSKSPGFPSGHMMILGIMFSIFYDNIYPKNKLRFELLSLIIIITTGLGRYFTNCHTIFQIISGLSLGLLAGYIINKMDESILENNKRYLKDKKTFYRDMNLIFD